jgi:DNA-binding transcriptional ArsR family regulator
MADVGPVMEDVGPVMEEMGTVMEDGRPLHARLGRSTLGHTLAQTMNSNSTPATASALPLTFPGFTTLVGSETRLRALSAFCSEGGVMAVSDLAARCGVSPNAMTKHMAVLRQIGVVEQGPGACYQLTARFRLPAGARELDLGYAVLKLDRLPWMGR